jgi:hypothetical protein
MGEGVHSKGKALEEFFDVVVKLLCIMVVVVLARLSTCQNL